MEEFYQLFDDSLRMEQSNFIKFNKNWKTLLEKIEIPNWLEIWLMVQFF